MHHPELACDDLGRHVVGMNDRYEPAKFQSLQGMVAHRTGRLGRDASPPVGTLDAVAELDLTGSVHLLDHQAALAEELSGALQLDNPETEPMLSIGAKVALDPADRLVPRLGSGVVAHRWFVGEHRRTLVDVGRCVLSQPEAARRDQSTLLIARVPRLLNGCHAT